MNWKKVKEYHPPTDKALVIRVIKDYGLRSCFIAYIKKPSENEPLKYNTNYFEYMDEAKSYPLSPEAEWIDPYEGVEITKEFSHFAPT